MKVKSLVPFIVSALAFAGTASGATVFISEFHYDNDGADTGEFVEIYVQSGTILADVRVTLYNGDTGETLGSRTAQVMANEIADALGIPATVSLDGIDFDIYTWEPSSIQNGPADGFSVDIAGVICEFITFEGVLTATAGPANGLTSTDVGVVQSGSTPIGSSIQLTDSGWINSNTNTFGAANPGLTVNPIPIPEPSAALLGGIALLGLLRRRR